MRRRSLIQPYEKHEYVEIAGVKWATMNIGANSEADPGLYFQWGDTLGYTFSLVLNGLKHFDLTDYKFIDTQNGQAVMIKYNDLDDKIVLDPEDDAATVLWGPNWRMPTADEFNTLNENNITFEYVANYNNSGINGVIFTDIIDTNKKAFVPFGGAIIRNEMPDDSNTSGVYWTSSRYGFPIIAYGNFKNNETQFGFNLSYPFAGCNIRPVYDPYRQYNINNQ